jgi:hypothetical protein
METNICHLFAVFARNGQKMSPYVFLTRSVSHEFERSKQPTNLLGEIQVPRSLLACCLSVAIRLFLDWSWELHVELDVPDHSMSKTRIVGNERLFSLVGELDSVKSALTSEIRCCAPELGRHVVYAWKIYTG